MAECTHYHCQVSHMDPCVTLRKDRWQHAADTPPSPLRKLAVSTCVCGWTHVPAAGLLYCLQLAHGGCPAAASGAARTCRTARRAGSAARQIHTPLADPSSTRPSVLLLSCAMSPGFCHSWRDVHVPSTASCADMACQVTQWLPVRQ